MSLESLIEDYFKKRHRYKVIVAYLKIQHGVNISLTTVKNILRQKRLRRNCVSTAQTDLTAALTTIQNNTRKRAGYRRSWHILNYQNNIRVTQRKVAECLRNLDMNSVRARTRQVLIRRSYFSPGPNHVWHLDGYDKIKPYGFAIHACIDGYSRRILWLNCSSSNNNPKVVLHHFLTTVHEFKGCPAFTRSDHGSETGLLGAAQCTLRNDDRAHIYGPSVRNERIEAWWSKLRTCWSQTWIEVFEELTSFGVYKPIVVVHRAVAEFCFMHLIQKELNEFKSWWNGHRVRKTRTSGCPGGIPNELHDLPQLNGARNHLKEVEPSSVLALIGQSEVPKLCTDETIWDFCRDICGLNRWSEPTNFREASSLYIRLATRLNLN